MNTSKENLISGWKRSKINSIEKLSKWKLSTFKWAPTKMLTMWNVSKLNGSVTSVRKWSEERYAGAKSESSAILSITHLSKPKRRLSSSWIAVRMVCILQVKHSQVGHQSSKLDQEPTPRRTSLWWMTILIKSQAFWITILLAILINKAVNHSVSSFAIRCKTSTVIPSPKTLWMLSITNK